MEEEGGEIYSRSKGGPPPPPSSSSSLTREATRIATTITNNSSKKKKKKEEKKKRGGDVSIPAWALVCLHATWGASLVAGVWALPRALGFSLVHRPIQTLFLALTIQLPVVLLGFSYIAVKCRSCSMFEALGRGLTSLPAGAVVAALGAIAFGAPITKEYLATTLHWSLLMSVLLIVPAAITFGRSWSDWQRVFAFTKPEGSADYCVCIPSHGAVIGAWLGAWPMPLDWERPWQEWPVCVTYGMVGGYLVGLLLSLSLILFEKLQHRKKQD